MFKFSKDLKFRKILIGKKITYNSIKIGKVNNVEIDKDGIVITVGTHKKYRDIISAELVNFDRLMIIADLGIELMSAK